MATKKRGGLGRGIGALIPQAAEGERPVDVFFPSGGTTAVAESASGSADETSPATEDAELREVPGATLTRLLLSEIVPNRCLLYTSRCV